MAMTADGKIATANRAVHSFGSARDLGASLRTARHGGRGDVRRADGGNFAKHFGNGGEKFRRQRLKHGLAEYNLRVIVSGSGSIDPAAEIFRNDFRRSSC